MNIVSWIPKYTEGEFLPVLYHDHLAQYLEKNYGVRRVSTIAEAAAADVLILTQDFSFSLQTAPYRTILEEKAAGRLNTALVIFFHHFRSGMVGRPPWEWHETQQANLVWLADCIWSTSPVPANWAYYVNVHNKPFYFMPCFAWHDDKRFYDTKNDDAVLMACNFRETLRQQKLDKFDPKVKVKLYSGNFGTHEAAIVKHPNIQDCGPLVDYKLFEGARWNGEFTCFRISRLKSQNPEAAMYFSDREALAFTYGQHLFTDDPHAFQLYQSARDIRMLEDPNYKLDYNPDQIENDRKKLSLDSLLGPIFDGSMEGAVAASKRRVGDLLGHRYDIWAKRDVPATPTKQ